MREMFLFTVAGTREKFRSKKPAGKKTAKQFAAPLSCYFDRGTELSETKRNIQHEGNVLIKAQFLSVFYANLSLYLKKKEAKSLDNMPEPADRVLRHREGPGPAKVEIESSEVFEDAEADRNEKPHAALPD